MGCQRFFHHEPCFSKRMIIKKLVFSESEFLETLKTEEVMAGLVNRTVGLYNQASMA